MFTELLLFSRAFGSISVCSDCSNKMLQTRKLINNRNLLLTVLEVQESRIRMSADLVSGEGSLSASCMMSSCYIFIRRRAKKHHWALREGRALPYRTWRAPPLTATTLEILIVKLLREQQHSDYNRLKSKNRCDSLPQ